MESFLGIGLAELALEERREALPHLIAGLMRAVEIGLQPVRVIAVVLAETAVLLADCGEMNLAVEQLVLALHQSNWKLAASVEKRAVDRLSKLESEMPAEAFNAAQERGQALDLQTSVDSLLLQLRTIQGGSSLASMGASNVLLTERELEILRLVAVGMSNKEIAEELVLAVNTVKWYISEIMSKLHVANRTQAVAHARTLGWLS
jgi:DNA-binding NarL/FixJ family response regulator